VAIPTNQYDPHGWAECVDGFIRVVQQTDKMLIVPVGAIVGPAHLVGENAASDRIDSVWLINHHVDIGTYWTVYSVTMPESWCAGGRELIELYYLI